MADAAATSTGEGGTKQQSQGKENREISQKFRKFSQQKNLNSAAPPTRVARTGPEVRIVGEDGAISLPPGAKFRPVSPKSGKLAKPHPPFSPASSTSPPAVTVSSTPDLPLPQKSPSDLRTPSPPDQIIPRNDPAPQRVPRVRASLIRQHNQKTGRKSAKMFSEPLSPMGLKLARAGRNATAQNPHQRPHQRPSSVPVEVKLPPTATGRTVAVSSYSFSTQNRLQTHPRSRGRLGTDTNTTSGTGTPTSSSKVSLPFPGPKHSTPRIPKTKRPVAVLPPTSVSTSRSLQHSPMYKGYRAGSKSPVQGGGSDIDSLSFVERIRERRLQKILGEKTKLQEDTAPQTFTFSTYNDDTEPKTLIPRAQKSRSKTCLAVTTSQPKRRVFNSAHIQHEVDVNMPGNSWQLRARRASSSPFNPELSPKRILRNVRKAMNHKKISSPTHSRAEQSMADIRQTGGIESWFNKRGKRFPTHIDEDTERKMWDVFQMIDKNNDDKIELRELQNALNLINIETSAPDIFKHLARIKIMSKKSSGFDFQMFLSALNKSDEWDALLATRQEYTEQAKRVEDRLMEAARREAYRSSLMRRPSTLPRAGGCSTKLSRQTSRKESVVTSIMSSSHDRKSMIKHQLEKARAAAKNVPLGGIPFHIWVPAYFRAKQMKAIMDEGHKYLEKKATESSVIDHKIEPWDNPSQELFSDVELACSPKSAPDERDRFQKLATTFMARRRIAKTRTPSPAARFETKNRSFKVSVLRAVRRKKTDMPKKLVFKDTFSARVRRRIGKQHDHLAEHKANLGHHWKLTKAMISDIHQASIKASRKTSSKSPKNATTKDMKSDPRLKLLQPLLGESSSDLRIDENENWPKDNFSKTVL